MDIADIDRYVCIYPVSLKRQYRLIRARVRRFDVTIPVLRIPCLNRRLPDAYLHRHLSLSLHSTPCEVFQHTKILQLRVTVVTHLSTPRIVLAGGTTAYSENVGSHHE